MQQVSGSYNINGEIPCVAVRLMRRLDEMSFDITPQLTSQTALDCESICPHHLFT